MQAINFKNFSDQDFTWKFDGIPFTIKAGQEIYLESFKADHFSRHLVDREMNRAGLPTNDPRRSEFLDQCFPKDDDTVSVEEAIDIEARKAVKERKNKKPEAKKEEEFEDLKEETTEETTEEKSTEETKEEVTEE